MIYYYPEHVSESYKLCYRWSLEDVATPSEECTTDGPEGYEDLTLKFKAQEIVAAFGEVEYGDVLGLQFWGNLKAEFDGTPIIGEDVVVIIKK